MADELDKQPDDSTPVHADEVRAEPIESESADSVPGGEEPSWEVVLRRAEEASSPPPEQSTDAPARPNRAAWHAWGRAAVPLAIILLYGIYKIATHEPAQPDAPEIANVASLSGVKQDTEKIRMDKAAREFIARLETLKASENWKQIRTEIDNTAPEIREHPVVQAFDVIALIESGQRNGALLARIQTLRPKFADDRTQRGMLDYLNLMEAELLLNASRSPDMLTRNMDDFRQLIGGQEKLTPRLLDFRVRLADRFEQMGDQEIKDAGNFRADQVKMLNGRSLYQQGLRWVTTRDGWLKAQPIDPGRAASTSQRLLLKIRDANQIIHGPVLPFGDKENTTWTGKRGDPVHDYPGGKW